MISLEVVLSGISKKWIDVFDIHKLKYAIDELNRKLYSAGVREFSDSMVRPKPRDILAAFRHFEPEDTKAIIIGQDPYPKEADAIGLSFSTAPGNKVPMSLKNIYKCLVKHGLSSEPLDGYLIKWVKQGVLLLNIYLTKLPCIIDGKLMGDSNTEIHTFWKPFTIDIIGKLSKLSNPYVMCWGQKSQLAVKSLRCEKYLEWSHPSPQAQSSLKGKPGSFENCNHFSIVGKNAGIDWNLGATKPAAPTENMKTAKDGLPSIKESVSTAKDGLPAIKESVSTVVPTIIEPTGAAEDAKQVIRYLAAIDGGAIKNGDVNCIASYGVVFPEKMIRIKGVFSKTLSGIVPRSKLEIRGDITDIVETSSSTPNTNNRGELLAIIRCFDEIIKDYNIRKTKYPITIISDSEYVINIVTNWIHKWAKSDFTDKKNIDYLRIIYAQLQYLSNVVPTKTLFNQTIGIKWRGLSMIHQKSHIEAPLDTNSYEYYYHKFNGIADSLCQEAISLEVVRRGMR